jgi:hypothetical protein
MCSTANRTGKNISHRLWFRIFALVGAINARTVFAVCSLFVLPVALVCSTVWIKKVMGPYRYSADPAYAYLLNSLALARLHQPGHIDHPGTPVQVLGAVTIRIAHKSWGIGDLDDDVLRDPESYLEAINYTTLACYVAMVLATGALTLWATRNLFLSLLMQVVPFLSMTALTQGTAYVQAEPLLLFFGTGFATTVLLFVELGSEKKQGRWATLFGIFSGLAIATKITAGPLMFIPLVLLRARYKVWYVVLTLVFFVFATVPILLKYPDFIRWVYNLARHSGAYGSGEASFIDGAVYVGALKSLVWDEPALFAVMVLNALVLGGSFFVGQPSASTPLSNRVWKGLLAILLTEIIQVLMVAKHGYSFYSHYLMPALALLGLNLVVVSRLIIGSRGPARLAYLLSSLVLLSPPLLAQIYRLHEAYTDPVVAANAREDIYREIDEKYKDCSIIYYYGASALPQALQFGNAYVSGRFSEKLQAMYPDALFLVDKGRIASFVGDVGLEEIASKNSCVLFQGWAFSKIEENVPSNVRLERVYPPGELSGEELIEVLHKLKKNASEPTSLLLRAAQEKQP